MKKLVCTYFDHNYLARGLALLESLFLHNPDFTVVVLCIDEITERTMREKFPSIHLIDLESYKAETNIEENRFKNKKEFLFSVTPNLCLMALRLYPDVETLLYLDADVYIYGNLDSIYDELGQYSIGVCSHRHGRIIKLLTKDYGEYNVGVNLFKNNLIGRNCLEHWKAQCDEWHPQLEGYPLTFFSDQIFLNSWPTHFKGVFTEIRNIGVNVAPWNARTFPFKMKNGKFFIKDQPLLIYHFSSLSKVGVSRWDVNTEMAFFYLNSALESLYCSYIRHLEKFELENINHAKLDTKISVKKRLFCFLMRRKIKSVITVPLSP